VLVIVLINVFRELLPVHYSPTCVCGACPVNTVASHLLLATQGRVYHDPQRIHVTKKCFMVMCCPVPIYVPVVSVTFQQPYEPFVLPKPGGLTLMSSLPKNLKSQKQGSSMWSSLAPNHSLFICAIHGAHISFYSNPRSIE